MREKKKRHKGSLFSVDMKTHPLPPSLREKKRYIVYEHMGNKQSFVALKPLIEKELKTFLGTLGTEQAGINILKDTFNYDKQQGVLKVNHHYVNHIKAAFATSQLSLRSIKTTGTLTKT
jgi:RNase P/RNase MRP subunit POP5